MLVLQKNAESLREGASQLFAGEPTGPAGLAEALRCELSARGVSGGRYLCERVQALLQPLGSVLQVIRGVLDDLADRGDVTAGPRGMFAAAPCRAVRVTEGQL